MDYFLLKVSNLKIKILKNDLKVDPSKTKLKNSHKKELKIKNTKNVPLI